MNIKKNLLKAVTIILFLIFAIAQGASVYASTSETAYMAIIRLMSNSTPSTGYSINRPQQSGAAVLYNIVRYTSAQSKTLYEGKDENIYCVKAGIGFLTDGRVQEDTPTEYNIKFNMKTERESIKGQNDVLQKLVTGPEGTGTGREVTAEGNIVQSTGTFNRYNALLALLDRIYLPKEKADDPSTEKEKNEALAIIKKEAKNTAHDYAFGDGVLENIENYNMTDNDFNAVQQAAIWYFTNYSEEKYDKIDKNNWLTYSTDGVDYEILENSVDIEKKVRGAQARVWYEYLIAEAKAKASEYANSETLQEAPVKVTSTALRREASSESGKTIVGPITFQKVNSRPYTIDFEVKNGGSNVDYTLLGSNKQTAKQKTVKELVEAGETFYLSVPTEKVDDLSVNITVNYENRTAYLWANTTQGDAQPLAEVEKESKSVPVELTVEEEKPLDLALRKYITKVNGEELPVNEQRVPQPQATATSTGASVRYNHRKNPVVVKEGDTINYKITIYNEGKKAGRAEKVVDQLPTGIEFLSVVDGKFVEDTYNRTTNILTLKRTTGNQDNLNAYSGTLDSETIEIQCKVTAVPDQVKTKILTNVAWISVAREEGSDVDIVQQDPIEGGDIDSKPGVHPNVTKDSMENYKGDTTNKDIPDDDDGNYYYKGEQDDDDFEKVKILPEAFDLKLIKYITSVNNQNVPNRIEDIDVAGLNTLDADGNMNTKTANYTLNKEPYPVKKGDIITYTFRIYNEGTINGYAEKITEDIPKGLELVYPNTLEEQQLTEEEEQAVKLNQDYLWGDFKYDENGKIIEASTPYLSKAVNETANLIPAFGRNDGTKTAEDLNKCYKEIKIAMKVVSDDISGTTIRNEAAITEDLGENGQQVDDRDSKTNEWKKYEDDEDYDQVKLKVFDLAVRKFVIAVSDDENIQNDEYLKDENGLYTRAPKVDTSTLNSIGADGNQVTTAIYNHSKEPVEVDNEDIVVYMIRVYNEGDDSAYAGEIKDHLPPYLTFIDNDYNRENGWSVSADGRTVTTTILADKVIEKAKLKDPPSNGADKYVLDYEEVPIMCKVNSTENNSDEAITNIVDITKYLDENKDPIDSDRDSQKDNVVLPKDDEETNEWPEYKDGETGEYIPGQQDDDDFEKVKIKPFDLALRKFITKIEENNVDTRIPNPVLKEDGQIEYQHGKDPLTVVNGQTVEYTIRVFNEGERNGYAAEITDDIPEGLEFLPENATNTQYRWKMYKKDGEQYVITNNPSEAEIITTDYLSKEQGEERMEEDDTLSSNPNLLKAFDKELGITDSNPDYRDVKVAFKVTEPNSSKKVIVNSAQISKDTDERGKDVDDEDSTPGEWNDGEDDQDREYIELKEFDLALRKWVTQAIVIENGKQTVTQTGHKPYDDPEQVVKVEIKQSMLNKVTVKFRYSIRVINEGDIEGYAKEVTDYVPQGLKFVASDNPGWTDEGNNIISTKLLENTLLQPGQYADLEVVLTWINSESGLGTVLTNTAEISEDDNPYDVPDKDSTPDNKKKGEDDIDDAPVILSIKTGQAKIYFGLGFIVLITVAGGIILIKKYVL